MRTSSGSGQAAQGRASILHAQVSAPTAAEAVRRFHAAVAQERAAFVLFFCSSSYDPAVIAREMARLFGAVPVVGCSTAGEIGPDGYGTATLSGASFPADTFTATARSFPVDHFTAETGHRLAQELLEELELLASGADVRNTFAFMTIDGLSVAEEPVTRALQAALGDIPLIGGSAGDDLRFVGTRVFCGGASRERNAVLLLVSTPLPFKPFMTQHFVASDRRMVVTAADVAQRVVHEIDGRPAAQAYAEMVGVGVGELGPARFAAAPMAVLIGGVGYVRSIRNVTPDGGLQFFCAIERGVVMRLARAADLLEDLERTFLHLRDEVGEPQLIIGCDCALRRLEIEQRGLAPAVSELLRRNRFVGFNGYGEQYRGVHVNQTLVGIAIGGNAESVGRE